MKSLELAYSYTTSASGVTLHVAQAPPNAALFQPGPALLYDFSLSLAERLLTLHRIMQLRHYRRGSLARQVCHGRVWQHRGADYARRDGAAHLGRLDGRHGCCQGRYEHLEQGHRRELGDESRAVVLRGRHCWSRGSIAYVRGGQGCSRCEEEWRKELLEASLDRAGGFAESDTFVMQMTSMHSSCLCDIRWMSCEVGSGKFEPISLRPEQGWPRRASGAGCSASQGATALIWQLVIFHCLVDGQQLRSGTDDQPKLRTTEANRRLQLTFRSKIKGAHSHRPTDRTRRSRRAGAYAQERRVGLTLICMRRDRHQATHKYSTRSRTSALWRCGSKRREIPLYSGPSS